MKTMVNTVMCVAVVAGLVACATSAGQAVGASAAAPVASAAKTVGLQLVRSATMRIEYAGKTILVDPMLSPKDTFDPFAGKARNPTVELPMPANAVVKGIDGVLVTHTHPDHFDPAAVSALPKGLPLFIQPVDGDEMRKGGFTDVRPVEGTTKWGDIDIVRTGGQHGSGKILTMMGQASGFVLRAQGWPTVYIVGDVVLGDEVRHVIAAQKPDIIVTFSGGAVIPGFETTPILMDAAATVELAGLSPKATVVAIHLESLDHLTVTRAALREAADRAGLGQRMIIPQDGQVLRLSAKK